MTAPTTDRLAGVRSKIEWAKKHINDIDARIKEFRDTNPYKVRTEDDPNTGDKIKKIDIRLPIPPTFPLVIGDAVHNLRSALDHLAWQLVEVNGGRQDTKTAFPTFETVDGYNARSAAKVQGMGVAAISLIEAVQPYQTGYGQLWALHQLDITDKHKLLLVATCAQNQAIVWFTDLTAHSADRQLAAQLIGPIGRQPNGRFAILENGAVIGRVPRGQPDVDFQLAFEIAFREPEIVKGEAVVPFLTQLSQLVERIVNEFVPLF